MPVKLRHLVLMLCIFCHEFYGCFYTQCIYILFCKPKRMGVLVHLFVVFYPLLYCNSNEKMRCYQDPKTNRYLHATRVPYDPSKVQLQFRFRHRIGNRNSLLIFSEVLRELVCEVFLVQSNSSYPTALILLRCFS